MEATLTVGQLKQLLQGVNEKLPVYVDVHGHVEEDLDMFYTDSARQHDHTGISNEHFAIKVSREFSW